jgi:hypothetical protein
MKLGEMGFDLSKEEKAPALARDLGRMICNGN